MDNLDFSTNAPQTTPDKPKRFQSCRKCQMVLPLTEFPPKRRMCKACKAQWDRQYYRKTRKRRAAYAKQYRAEHKAEIAAQQAQYRRANKQKLLEYARAHYRANAQARCEYRRNYYRAHRKHEQVTGLQRYERGKARRYARMLQALAAKKGGQE